MNKLALAGACLALSAVSAHAQYVDGLPAAASVSSGDLLPVVQGSTPIAGGGFLPGSGTARRATVGQIANAVGNAYVPYSGASSAVNLGGFPLTLGVASAPSAPGTGGALYVDSSNVLHYLNAGRDFPLAGAKYNNDSSINWWIGQYGIGDPAAPSNEYATLRVQKSVVGSGGAGLASTIVAADYVAGTNGASLNLISNVSAGSSTIVMQEYGPTTLTPGMALNAPGLANGTTIASVQHSTPVAGQATVTLSAPTATAMYTPNQIGIGTSGATDDEQGMQTTCDTWQNSGNLLTCVGIFSVGRKWVPGGVIPFGATLVGSDLTGLSSTHSGSGVVGVEVDANGSGPDDHNWFVPGVTTSAVGIRKAIHIALASLGPAADGPGVIGNGSVITLAGPGQASEPTTALNGYNVLSIPGWGNVQNAFASDGSGAGQNGLSLSSGYVTFKPLSPASSGTNQITIGKQPITVGQIVSDASACVPAGTTVSSVAEGFSLSNVVVTLSANLTCNVTTSDGVTFTNKFADGWLASGFYTDAFANLTNTGAAGVVKIGSTLNAGNIASLNFQGQNSNAVAASYGALNWNIQINAAGSERGQAVISLPNAGDFNAGSGNTQTLGTDFALGANNAQSSSHGYAVGESNTQSAALEWALASGAAQSGTYSTALGYKAADFGLYGTVCHANGQIATTGDAENCTVNLRAATLNTTPTRLTADGATAGSANVLNLSAGSAAALKIAVVAADVTNKGNVGAWDVPIAALSRSGAASTTAYSGAAASFQSVGAGAPTSGALAFAADTANGGLSVTWTAPNADTWHVVARVQAELTQ